jgi:predicted dehydrogenase
MNRRVLLKGGAAAGAILILSPSAARTYAANAKLNAALIGTGGRGGAHFGWCQKENFVAMCDVDSRNLVRKPEAAKTYTDYRKLFDAHKDLNVVFVATPDHHHFLASMLALEAGANVYTEKPLTWSPWEARKLREFARQKKAVTQCGNQGRGGAGWRMLAEYIWTGAIGDVTEVHCQTVHGGKHGGWPQGHDRPAKTALPEGLDWESWIGPAPMRDYHAGLHPFAWRGWQEFGTGGLGDQCCHVMDAAFSALKLGEAESVEVSAEHTPMNKETWPKGATVTYKFPARGKMPSVILKWFLGDNEMPRPKALEENRRVPGHGTFYYGTKGIMTTGQYCDGPRLIPESRHKEVPVPKPSIPMSKGHWEEFLTACRDKTAPAPMSNYDYSATLTEIALLGNMALRGGKGFTYKIAEGRVVNCPEAEAFFRREPRKGWDFGY